VSGIKSISLETSKIRTFKVRTGIKFPKKERLPEGEVGHATVADTGH
jgi:hypothetical protein